MEYCNQGTLQDYVLVNRPDIKQCLQIFVQLLRGFRDIHEKGFLHRDLKPDNIYIKDGIFKIADFGLSKPSKTGYTYCGTPNFMAPEIFQRQRHDYKVDLWSLGVVLYFMIFNDYPFDAKIVMLEEIKKKTEPIFDLLQNIQLKKNKLSQKNKFNYDNITKITKDLIDLFQKIFVFNPKNRITFQELYELNIFDNIIDNFERSSSKHLYSQIERTSPVNSTIVHTNTKQSKFQFKKRGSRRQSSIIIDQGSVKEVNKIQSRNSLIYQVQTIQINETQLVVEDDEGLQEKSIRGIQFTTKPQFQESQFGPKIDNYNPQQFYLLGDTPISNLHQTNSQINLQSNRSIQLQVPQQQPKMHIVEFGCKTKNSSTINSDNKQLLQQNKKQYQLEKQSQLEKQDDNDDYDFNNEEEDEFDDDDDDDYENDESERKQNESNNNNQNNQNEVSNRAKQNSSNFKLQEISEEFEDNEKNIFIIKKSIASQTAIKNIYQINYEKLFHKEDTKFREQIKKYLFELDRQYFLREIVNDLKNITLSYNFRSLLYYLFYKIMIFYAQRIHFSLQQKANLLSVDDWNNFLNTSSAKEIGQQIQENLNIWHTHLRQYYNQIDVEQDITNKELQALISPTVQERDYIKQIQTPFRQVLIQLQQALIQYSKQIQPTNSNMQDLLILQYNIFLCIFLHQIFTENKYKLFFPKFFEKYDCFSFLNFSEWVDQMSLKELRLENNYIAKMGFGNSTQIQMLFQE